MCCVCVCVGVDAGASVRMACVFRVQGAEAEAGGVQACGWV